MDESVVVETLRNALELPFGTLSLQTRVKDVDVWDSIGWLTVISVLDDEFGIQLPSKVIRSISTVQDVVDFVRSHARSGEPQA